MIITKSIEKIIFGKNIQINFEDDAVETHLLQQELSIYPNCEKGDAIDLKINFLKQLHIEKEFSRNPAIHSRTSEGFVGTIGSVKVFFKIYDNILAEIDFTLLGQHNGVKDLLNRWKDIQYTNVKEAIGQIFHECVLVPAAFFFNDYSIVHSSAVQNIRGQALLFGGTGGVGKTSLEIELCKNYNCQFIADDICVTNNDGYVYPNLAYPKIYGYNVVNDENLFIELFKNRTVLDKLHWKLHLKRGGNKVRRRAAPNAIYDEIKSLFSKICYYFVLTRQNVEKISIEEISSEKAAKLNALVMSSEYDVLFKHLFWHEYNSTLLDIPSEASYTAIMNKIEANFRKGLANVLCYQLKIPINMSHETFKKEIIYLLKDELGVL